MDDDIEPESHAKTSRVARSVYAAATHTAQTQGVTIGESIAGCMAGTLTLITVACGTNMAARREAVELAIFILQEQTKPGSTTLPTERVS